MHQTQIINTPSEILFAQLTAKVESSYVKAEHFFERTFTRASIRLDLRGQSAGTASPHKNLIRFNKSLLMDNQTHFLNQTVPHEVAHLVAYQLFGLAIKPHGKEWQHIMQTVYQLPAERCHHYPLVRKTKRYYLYNCHCDELLHPLSARRHHLIAEGYRYICKYCKKTLNYTGRTDYQ